MARPGGPWWWKARGRWAATVGGVRRVAPAEIPRDDRAAAWAWYSAEAGEAARPRAAATVADLFNAYLDRCARRVARGEMSPGAERLAGVVFTRACGFAAAGAKFGAIPATDVKRTHLEAVMAAWARRPGRSGGVVSTSYLATAAGVVRTAFRWAVHPDDGSTPLIPADPFAGYKPPPARPAAVSIPGRADAAAWLRWLRRDGDREFLLLQRLLIATGARPSEFTRATWGEIRWDAGRTAAGATYGLLIRGEWKNARKSGKPRRIFLMPSVLRALRRRFDRLRPAPGDLIFRSPWGRPWSPENLAQATARRRATARAAGVDMGGLEGDGEGRARPYLWRHLAASRLVMAGVDLVTIGDLLGTSPAMIARTYGHLSDGHVRAAAERLLTSGRGGSGRPGAGPGA